MRHLVVDASAWIEILCGKFRSATVRSCILSSGHVHVPALCDVEVVAGLRKLVSRSTLTPTDGVLALDQYLAAPIQRHDHETLLPHVFDLRDNFTAYDATYVVLAHALNATLATFDRRLARAAREHLGLATVGV